MVYQVPLHVQFNQNFWNLVNGKQLSCLLHVKKTPVNQIEHYRVAPIENRCTGNANEAILGCQSRIPLCIN